MHAEKPGQSCDHGCGSIPATVPADIHEWPTLFHTTVPIEGVGVVHITTAPPRCRFDYWSTDVVLWRYSDGAFRERVHLTGTGCSTPSAKNMHTYWCDLETLTLCVQGVPSALHIIDEYSEHKQRELGLL